MAVLFRTPPAGAARRALGAGASAPAGHAAPPVAAGPAAAPVRAGAAGMDAARPDGDRTVPAIPFNRLPDDGAGQAADHRAPDKGETIAVIVSVSRPDQVRPDHKPRRYAGGAGDTVFGIHGMPDPEFVALAGSVGGLRVVNRDITHLAEATKGMTRLASLTQEQPGQGATPPATAATLNETGSTA